MKKITLIIALFLSISFSANAIERRKDQFPKQFGYFLAPVPYSLAGIGDGIAFLGSVNNIFETNTDVFGGQAIGDAEASFYALADLHLIPETLIFDTSFDEVKKVALNVYSKRGMDTEKDDFNILVLKSRFAIARLTLSFFDRMLEFYGYGYENAVKLKEIRDNDGDIITETDSSEEEASNTMAIGATFDWTDDFLDPRVGVRLDVNQTYTPRSSKDNPDFSVRDYNLTFYIPLGKTSTWVFNYYRSDALVRGRGETNRAAVLEDLNLNCDSEENEDSLEACLEALDVIVDDRIAANKYGTASPLGGRLRLRSYPEGRFNGSHTAFYGTELRWNLTEESTPFDIWLIRDIRTVMQVALFYEVGSVSDDADKLGDERRDSYGTGFRLVTGSGLVYRIDVANGQEGINPTVIVNYPWGSF
ncbi:MAG: BamA/TamA family outer membrane protein [SAR324 cluster bacterium]|nr:BamA/TamA family outer membrane protein [SAR324 cluster bacterium]